MDIGSLTILKLLKSNEIWLLNRNQNIEFLGLGSGSKTFLGPAYKD